MNIDTAQTEKHSDIKLPGLEKPSKIVGKAPAPSTESPYLELLAQPAPIGDNKLQSLFAWESHKYHRDFLNNADNKAHRYIVFATAFLIWMLKSGNYTSFLLVSFVEWKGYDFISLLSILTLCACIGLSLLALTPTLKGSKKGIIYFGSVAEHETKMDYLNDVLHKNEQGIVAEVVKHGYELAKICNKKFQKLQFATWCGGIGLILGIILILFYRPSQVLNLPLSSKETTKINQPYLVDRVIFDSSFSTNNKEDIPITATRLK